MRDWLEEDHLVYRLLDVVELLDIRSVSHLIAAMSLLRARNGPETADPGNNCLIFKDSQGESQ